MPIISLMPHYLKSQKLDNIRPANSNQMFFTVLVCSTQQEAFAFLLHLTGHERKLTKIKCYFKHDRSSVLSVFIPIKDRVCQTLSTKWLSKPTSI